MYPIVWFVSSGVVRVRVLSTYDQISMMVASRHSPIRAPARLASQAGSLSELSHSPRFQIILDEPISYGFRHAIRKNCVQYFQVLNRAKYRFEFLTETFLVATSYIWSGELAHSFLSLHCLSLMVRLISFESAISAIVMQIRLVTWSHTRVN